MIPATLSPLANHLWQSTLCAAVVWLLALALRKNRAAVRHGLWLAASVKFLIPFSLLVAAGSRLEWRIADGIAPASLPVAIEQIALPFAVPVADVAAVAETPSANPVPAILFVIWLCGVAVSVVVWFRLYARFRAALRAATPLSVDLPIPVFTSPARQEPGVFGIRKPILLLPESIADRLTPGQLQSIFAHELCHVRRRDNLTGAVHMLVESIFWFHPVAWWIGARLVEERERACDEEVVRMGNEPSVYAEGILNVCRFSVRSALPCAAGVTGADLKKRIEAIMDNRISPRLTAARRTLLAAAGVAALVTPVLIGLWRAPSGNAQSQERLVFEVASIKRAVPTGQPGPLALAFGLTPGGGIRGSAPLSSLITFAYRIDPSQLSGGPAWISDRYQIQAKPEKFDGPDDPNVPPSEQHVNRIRERAKALLADRFRLVVRTETKESSVYVLSVAKGGHKLTTVSERRGGVRQGFGTIESFGAPISFLIVALKSTLGRLVLDETGLDGEFKFKMEFRHEIAVPPGALPPEMVAENDTRPSIFTAIEKQLGLQLQSKKGPIQTIVIERIERPTEN